MDTILTALALGSRWVCRALTSFQLSVFVFSERHLTVMPNFSFLPGTAPTFLYLCPDAIFLNQIQCSGNNLMQPLL